MIWDRTKKGILDIGGELVHFEVKIPSALEMEDIVSNLDENGRPKMKDSDFVKRFCTTIEGFSSVDEFLNCGQSYWAMKAIGGFIVESSKLDCEVKN